MPPATDPRPIGVFDSGVGGLTVLSELRRRLRAEATVYLGDNARAPYGPRPADEVRRFTLESIGWLLERDVKLLVLACNTASAQALEPVRRRAFEAGVPVLGVIRPGAVAAAATTRSGRVGVIATAGTVASDAYRLAIEEADPGTRVFQQACPLLVPLVEAGSLDGPEVESVLRGYLDDLLPRDVGLDTLLLGCTHYPLLRTVIERIVGPGVSVVDSAFTTALAVEDLLDALGARSGTPSPGLNRIVTTGDVRAFTGVAERIFATALPNVESAAVIPVLP